MRKCAPDARDNSHKYQATNPLQNGDTKKRDVDKPGDPNSDCHNAKMPPAPMRRQATGDGETNGAKQKIGGRDGKHETLRISLGPACSNACNETSHRCENPDNYDIANNRTDPHTLISLRRRLGIWWWSCGVHRVSGLICLTVDSPTEPPPGDYSYRRAHTFVNVQPASGSGRRLPDDWRIVRRRLRNGSVHLARERTATGGRRRGFEG